MADEAGYLGRNRFLRWWPKLLLGLAALILVVNPSHAIQWVTVLLPHRVRARPLVARGSSRSGRTALSLAFPFGRRLFLPRTSLTVRMEVVGAVAMVGRRRHFGYLLMERIGYEPDNEELPARRVLRLRLHT